jgi:general secretion pathway protein G
MNSGRFTRSSSSTARGIGGATLVSIVTYLGALIGMIVVIGVIYLRPSCGKSISGIITSDFKPMQNALEIYKLEGGSYPSTAQGLKALIEKPVSEPVPAKWQQTMKFEPLDPWKNPYGYKYPGSKDSTKPELISAGPDGIFGNEDDFSSQDP